MSKSDWQRFYHAVDELQPDLMEQFAQHLGFFGVWLILHQSATVTFLFPYFL